LAPLPGRGDRSSASLGDDIDLVLDDRQEVDTFRLYIFYLATPLKRSGSQKSSHQGEPRRPTDTPVPDPEKIISKGKALQRQASGSAKAVESGIQINTPHFISEKPLIESPAEIYNSQEIKNFLKH
jgi:hypothetical protein